LPEALEKEIQVLAAQAFNATEATGWGRVDVMLDKDSRPWFLEINTVPGMTDHSLVPMAAKSIGISFNELVIKILEMAIKEDCEALSEVSTRKISGACGAL
jgi:D-alanine-D-alanine ligase